MVSTDDTAVPQYPDRLRLDGRGFIVIGAGQGIGRQTTHALAACGATVFCIDNQEQLAKEVAEEVGGIPHVLDATKRDEVVEGVAEAKRALGRIHGLVDIVGMARWEPFLKTSDETWDWTFDMVIRHAFLFGQEAGKVMTADGGGSMVFIASVSGITSAPLHSPYGAAKAGLMSLVRTMAVELGPSGIRVNAVAPGMVWTPRVSQMIDDEGKQRNIDNTPLRRVALPEDIAGAALFLSSDLAGFVSGHTVVVDGGVGAKFPYPILGG